MKFVHSDELDNLVDSISWDLLRDCLDALTLPYAWRFSSNAAFENINDFRDWEEMINVMYGFKEANTICVIFKIKNENIHSIFVRINPDHLSQLEPALRQVLKLKAFL
jgi:hypothetical protein